MRTHHLVLAIGVLLVGIGAFIADRVQTAGGTIAIDDVQFLGSNGNRLAGLLYVPPGASAEQRAPGILAVHGYINSRETQSGFAIEFARRGYVVLALDQTGHGLSEPPAFGHGFGGVDGLAHLRGLPMVDADNIGLEGHSMGGWAVLAAAAAVPDGYRAMVLEGSSTGSFGAPDGTPTFPRNVAVVFSTYDEFSDLMWGVPTGAAVADSAKLQKLFGTTAAVTPGRIYGDPAAGTARVLYVPAVTHPGDHLSTAAIRAAVRWFARTLRGGGPLPARDQVWYWKEVGTLIALIGMVLAVIGAGLTLLRLRRFREFVRPIAPTSAARWPALRALLTTVIPVLTYFPLFNVANASWPVSAWWPQQLSNGLVLWSLTNALLALVVMLILGRRVVTLEGLGVWPAGFRISDLLRAMNTAALAVGLGYLLLLVIDRAFNVDFRFWVVAFKRLADWHVVPFVTYLIPLSVFFVVLGASIREFTLRGTTTQACLRAVPIVTGGFVALLYVQYVPLLFGQPLPLGEPLLTILAIQFVALLTIAAVIATVFQRASGSVYVGAFINALLVTWSVVAGQATQFAL
jgi:pimeloyl-ACP methyl ester carboxylesterase